MPDVLSLGFSLISAPSSAAVMETLTPDQVGAGAAVNETTRELGGTMGVAVVGSVFSSIFGPQVRFALAHIGMAGGRLATAQRSMQAATATVAHLPLSLRSPASVNVTRAFMDGLHRGCVVGALVAAIVAIAALGFLPGRRVALAESALQSQIEVVGA